jgi:hypothetical protein
MMNVTESPTKPRPSSVKGRHSAWWKNGPGTKYWTVKDPELGRRFWQERIAYHGGRWKQRRRNGEVREDSNKVGEVGHRNPNNLFWGGLMEQSAKLRGKSEIVEKLLEES